VVAARRQPDAGHALQGAGDRQVAVARSGEGEAEPIPKRYHPLTARFRHISGEMSASELGEIEFSAADVEEALGLRRESGGRLLLGYYTSAGMEHLFYRYGILDHLRRVGYDGFRVAFDRAGLGERMRLFGEVGGAEHALVELVLEKRHLAGAEVLFVHWLSLRNPRARFSTLRPRLPGQEVPGLGLAREMGEMLALAARRAGLAGVAFRPAHYHTAFSARHNFAFVDGARQGRFLALLRDLGPLPLREATAAVSEGRVALGGQPYTWEADDMALWLGAHPETAAHEADVARERERCHFTVLARPAGPRAASAADGPSPRPTPGERGG
jgi:hypothetical protein